MNHWRLLRACVRAWLEDDAFRMAAALAYYSIVSSAPLLLIALDVSQFFLEKRTTSGERQHSLEILVGRGPAKAIEDLLSTMNAPGGNGLFPAVNFAIFLFGSVWVFIAIQDCLNSIWKARSRAGVSWIARARSQLLLFALVLGIGLLLLILLAASATLATWARAVETLPGALFHGLNVVLSLVLVTILFGLIYKLLPEAQVRWAHAWAGGLVASLLHSLGNYGIGVYLAHSSLNSLYGAASSVIVIMLWVYCTSLGFLLGAEYARQLGIMREAQPAG